jgi:hypothetical protein
MFSGPVRVAVRVPPSCRHVSTLRHTSSLAAGELASLPVAVYLNHPLDPDEAFGGVDFVTSHHGMSGPDRGVANCPQWDSVS